MFHTKWDLQVSSVLLKDDQDPRILDEDLETFL